MPPWSSRSDPTCSPPRSRISGPHQQLTVRIEYQEELDYRAGRFSLRFPLVVGPRFIPGSRPVDGFAGTGWGANSDEVPDAARITPPVIPPGSARGNPCRIEVSLDAGLPLARVTSPSHPITTRNGPAGDLRVTLAEGEVPANADFVLEWEPEVGTAPAAALFSEEFEGETYALLMVMPPESAAEPVHSLPREAIFVVDVSGSMHGASMGQARAALDLAIQGLSPDDRFNVIPFASSATALFPESVAATPFARQQARAYVANLAANGGTNMQSALELALRDRPREGGAPAIRQVVFITDGAVGNERALFQLIQRDLGRSRLFPVGIGSAPNAFFMRKAALFGRGSTTWIGSPQEVGEKMSALFERLESPALGGIEVHFPSSGVEAWPARVPDLYLGEPIVLVARVPRLGGELRIEGSRGRAPFRVDLPFSGGGAEGGLHKLWARRKVAALMDARHDGAPADEVKQAVVDLGLRHHLVTRHTSLVAVERVPVAPRDTALQTRNVPTEMPRGGSFAHVFGAASPAAVVASQGMPNTATPAALFGLLALGCLAAASVLVALDRRHRSR